MRRELRPLLEFVRAAAESLIVPGLLFNACCDCIVSPLQRIARALVPQVALKVSCESDFALSFSVDPFPDISGAAAEPDALRLTLDEEPNHIEIYER